MTTAFYQGKWPTFIVFTIALVVAAFNGAYFLVGYWLTADDVTFLQLALEGWQAQLDGAVLYSQAQGRIGQLAQIILNSVGAYYADQTWFRILYVAAYFGWMGAFLIWIDRAAGVRIAGLAFLLVAGTFPLHYMHLPPNAFPLQNTVPYAIVIAMRLVMLTTRRGDRLSHHAIWALPIFSAALLFNEYALLFGTGMLAVEYGMRLAQSPRLSTARNILSSKAIWIDLASCVLPVVIYGAYRAAFPTQYGGNTLDGVNNAGAVAKTWIAHTLELHSWAWAELPIRISMQGPATTGIWILISIGVALGTAIAIAKCPRSTAYPALAAVALAFSFYQTVLPSLTVPQQDWCTQLSTCVFLDSRAAFPANIVAVVALTLWAKQSLPVPVLAKTLTVAFAIFVGATTYLTLVHNERLEASMRDHMQLWASAEVSACTFEGDLQGLREHIDPSHMVAIHPHIDPDQFWATYLGHKGVSCPDGRTYAPANSSAALE